MLSISMVTLLYILPASMARMWWSQNYLVMELPLTLVTTEAL
jgi:hypothetical protein